MKLLEHFSLKDRVRNYFNCLGMYTVVTYTIIIYIYLKQQYRCIYIFECITYTARWCDAIRGKLRSMWSLKHVLAQYHSIKYNMPYAIHIFFTWWFTYNSLKHAHTFRFWLQVSVRCEPRAFGARRTNVLYKNSHAQHKTRSYLILTAFILYRKLF